jgi:predicted permease
MSVSILRRITNLFHRSKLDQEIDAELRAHIEMRTADNIAAGMSPKEARRQAVLRFGSRAAMKERVIAADAHIFLDSLWQDLHYALRQLRRSPGFTAVAVLTLALGIGANTTVLSIVSALILRKPPVREPNGLITILSKDPANKFPVNIPPVSAADYLDWRAQATDFSSMAAADFDDFTISGDFTPQFVPGARVSANFFQVMQVEPVIGRLFTPGEDEAGKDQAVLISTQLWKGKFAGDSHILGREIKINGNRHVIVGVIPAAFATYDSPAQIWCPLVFSNEEFGPGKRGFRFLRVFARLKPGVSISQAAAQMNIIAARLSEAHPDSDKNWGAQVMTELQYMHTGNGATRALLVLGMAVAFVLLIACANVASMLLAHNSARAQEFSIRAVLGAGRLRLARQLLTECLLLSLAGGVFGILFAFLSIRVIVSQFNWNETVATLGQTIGIDSRVLLFATLISVLVAIVVGIAPALRLSKSEPGERLKQTARGATGARQRLRLQRLLVIGQIFLSVILLTASSLFVQEFIGEMRAATGLNPKNVLTASVNLRGLEYYVSAQRQSDFFQNALRKVRESPEVESAAITTTLPFEFPDSASFIVEGHSVPKPADIPRCGYFALSPGYFHTLQIQVLQGREFTASDGPSAPAVAVVDSAFARRYFPNESPLGHYLLINGAPGPHGKVSEIVGVVGDVNEVIGQQQPRAHIFVPFFQQPAGNMSFVMRTRIVPARFSDSFRHAIWSVDSAQAVSDVKTMERVISDSGSGDNIMAELMGGFAFVALLMAAAGIYGVLSYLVAQRSHEIGIRMALGAERRNVLALVMRNGLVLISIGVGAGVLVSLALPRLIASMFSGFGGHGCLLIFGMALTVTLVALLACYIPARRAMRVDPMVALRYE